MTRTIFQILALIAVVGMTGCATDPIAWYYHPAINQIENDLPLGTPEGHVEAYLTDHDVDHHYLSATNEIIAYVHNVRRDSFVQPDRTLIFSFDEYHRLTEILVKPTYTAP